MKASLQCILDAREIMVIDGSMSTALENMGLDLNHRLWTARALAENPEQVKQVHTHCLCCGSTRMLDSLQSFSSQRSPALLYDLLLQLLS